MKLKEEFGINVIGVFLAVILFFQIIGAIATEKQQEAYQRVIWLNIHSNKSISLLSNFSNLFVLDKQNTDSNFKNYRKGFDETVRQQKQISLEEESLFEHINRWKMIGQIVSGINFVLLMLVLWFYLKIIFSISKRLNLDK